VRPVDQTAYGIYDGNCFSACLASILEISIEVVPLFLGSYWDDFLPWLADRGLGASCYRKSESCVPLGYSIAGGSSKRFAGRMHACVAYNGMIVHDPHPSRDGLPYGIDEYLVIHGFNGESRWFNGVDRGAGSGSVRRSLRDRPGRD
jgi:hypothetical protein